jgi:hypothetical protein
LSCLLALTCVQPLIGQDADYKMQGEYSGSVSADGEELKFGLQVIALGEGSFTGVGYRGGLPGDGWDMSDPKRVENVKAVDGKLSLTAWDATVQIGDGVATVLADGQAIGKLMRLERKSPTLGKKPPKGAVVLFDGSSVDGWEHKGKPANMTEDGLLKQGAQSKKTFGDHKLHIEFLLPYMPKARGQGRGNSGLYLQGRYEVQMLDSFGLTGENNECGGIYSIKKPDENMCLPPMQWQTYDVEFHAAKFAEGKKVKDAWMTVAHNGVVIHEKVKLPKKTTAAPNNEGPGPGFIYLQNHGNEVRYRNIWVDKLDSKDAAESKVDESKQDCVLELSGEQETRQSNETYKAQIEMDMDYVLYLPAEYEKKKIGH